MGSCSGFKYLKFWWSKLIRVLLIDDDEDFTDLARRFIAREDPSIDLIIAKSAPNGLQKLAEKDVDVIVLDYQMPEINGLELLELLRKEGVWIPVIIFTGRGREDTVIRALNLGADYYLKKGGELKSQFAELSSIINRIAIQKLPAHEKIAGRVQREGYLGQKSSLSSSTSAASLGLDSSAISEITDALSQIETSFESRMAIITQEIAKELKVFSNTIHQELSAHLHAVESHVQKISTRTRPEASLQTRMAAIPQEIASDIKDLTTDLRKEIFTRLLSIEEQLKDISISEPSRPHESQIDMTNHFDHLERNLRKELSSRVDSVEKQTHDLSTKIGEISSKTPVPQDSGQIIRGSRLITIVRRTHELKETGNTLIDFLEWKNASRDETRKKEAILDKIKESNIKIIEISSDSTLSPNVRENAEELYNIILKLENILKGSIQEDFGYQEFQTLVQGFFNQFKEILSQIG